MYLPFCHFHVRVIKWRRNKWFHLLISRTPFAAKHSWTTLHMSRSLLVGSYLQATLLALGQWKGRLKSLHWMIMISFYFPQQTERKSIPSPKMTFAWRKKSVSDKSGSIKELCTWMPILNLDMIPSLKSFTKKTYKIITIFYLMQLYTYAYI